MEKDMRLVNIYIKIHNHQNLVLDDLAYLAKYNPECFRKTCDNLFYNMPESKPYLAKEEKSPENESEPISTALVKIGTSGFEILPPDERIKTQEEIHDFLDNMRHMESQEVDAVQNVDINQVKDLMGNLYMEMMFPHSGKPGYFQAYDQDPKSTFNVRA